MIGDDIDYSYNLTDRFDESECGELDWRDESDSEQCHMREGIATERIGILRVVRKQRRQRTCMSRHAPATPVNFEK